MFSHVVIFWTNPENPNATEDLIAGMEKYLRPISGVRLFHIGKMVTSPRPVVEQSYQVALNLTFDTKDAQDAIRFIRCTWSSWRKSSSRTVLKR